MQVKQISKVFYSTVENSVRIFLTSIALVLSACGGGEQACTEPPPRAFTQAQVSALSAADIKTVSDVELQAIGTNIKYLSNPALAALQDGVSNTNLWCGPHKAQIYSITPEQIAVLSPAQVRFIGSSETGTSKIAALSPETFKRLVSDTAQVVALTVAEMATIPSTKFTLIAGNFKHLTPEVMVSLKEFYSASVINEQAQIYAITPDQIASLTPAQVRLLGAYDTGVSKIAYLNPNTFTRLVSDPQQVAAMTVAEVATLPSTKFTLIAGNFKYLTAAVMVSLKEFYSATPINDQSQIHAITPEQIASLTPAQVRVLGSYDTGYSKIAYLSPTTFTRLVSDPAQVAAFTPAEIATFKSGDFVALGSSFGALSDSVLASLQIYFSATPTNGQSQIASITPGQIAQLTPAQVRILGSFDNGISKINFLNLDTFKALVSNPAQVKQITPTEITTLYSDRITAFGVNINALTNSALGNLNYQCSISVSSPQCQVQSLSYLEVTALSPAQIMVLASLDSGKGIAYLNVQAFRGLSPVQVAPLTPNNVKSVSPEQLAALQDATLAAFQDQTKAAFTAAQKSWLTPAQRSACGCS